MSVTLPEPVQKKRDQTQPSAPSQQRVVERHFQTVSTEWGTRYERRPRKMSDLDLLLRRQSVHHFLKPILINATEPLRVLDLGCGSGHVWDGIRRDRVELLGADIVPEMVRAAANHNPQDYFLVADAATLPIANGSLDIITCLGVLEYLRDPSKALGSMVRALRPTGHLLISFPNKTGLFRRLTRCEVAVERWLESKFRRLVGKHGNQTDSPTYKHNQWSLVQARKLLESAGFEIHTVRFNTFGLWGRLGRLRASLFISEWLTHQFGHCQLFSSMLACTMVVHARLAAIAQQPSLDGRSAPINRLHNQNVSSP
ncbi:MAG: methyltransferase domain-containing protein [Planctomycetota bacterium]